MFIDNGIKTYQSCQRALLTVQLKPGTWANATYISTAQQTCGGMLEMHILEYVMSNVKTLGPNEWDILIMLKG